MSLEQLYQSMEQQLVNFGKKLWPADPVIAWREEAEKLCADLIERQAILESKRLEANLFRRQVLKQEVRATMLASQIESCVFIVEQTKAWQYALELDQVREALQRDRGRLSNLENVCRYLEKAFRVRDRRLALLQERLELASHNRSVF